MGIDFIRRAAPTFKKSWDWQRVILATPTLFTQQPTCVPRTVAADILSGVTLQEGEIVTVQFIGSNLVGLRGLSQVVHFSDLRIPRQSCHRFQVNPATDSTAKLPPVPHESCH